VWSPAAGVLRPTGCSAPGDPKISGVLECSINGGSNNWYQEVVRLGFVPIAGGVLVVADGMMALRHGRWLCVGPCVIANGDVAVADCLLVLPSLVLSIRVSPERVGPAVCRPVHRSRRCGLCVGPAGRSMLDGMCCQRRRVFIARTMCGSTGHGAWLHREELCDDPCEMMRGRMDSGHWVLADIFCAMFLVEHACIFWSMDLVSLRPRSSRHGSNHSQSTHAPNVPTLVRN
jgi:hypothetical protein